MIGTTVSHYRILEKLGEGGMGVVYKAHDTELDRDVALKFLPYHITVNEAEQARFQQEARAAAVLNHANICTVHAIEKADDQQFIVMEYVDGKTLRQLVPVQKTQMAIDYAIQIGEALQEAHSKGIVHRDVKAENVMVNSKNQIKVMDFGLAKLKGSLKLTRTSSTVGTLGYMAPEQIQGGEADHRSDIFSFGVLLFEMLTGKLPFRGEHEAAMMYSILNEEPESLQKYSSDAPLELLHVLNRALEKNPEDRYQSVHDMVIDLRRSRKETARVSKTFAVSSGELSSAPREVKPLWHSNVWYGVGVVTVLAVAALLFFWPRSTVELNPNRTSRPLKVPYTDVSYPALSSEGNWVAFVASDANGKRDIYFMNSSGGEPKQVTSDSSNQHIGSYVDVSPDHSTIAFSRDNPQTDEEGICVIPSLGGLSKTVTESGTHPKWRPDSERLGYIVRPSVPSGKPEFWTVTPRGANRERVFIDSAGGIGRISFAWSPDGESVAWVRTRPGNTQELVLFLKNNLVLFT